MLQSSECFHPSHKACLEESIVKDRAKQGFLNCPECEMQLKDYELKEHVTEQQWKEVESS